MTTSSRDVSRNIGVRNLAERDGQEETKQYVKNHYGLDPNLKTWKEIDDAAEKAQAVLNKS